LPYSVAHHFGVLLALAAPMVSMNALVGQTGFLTAALIGGTLYLIPIRPLLVASASGY
jgi:arabinofuranan 3-O-arabinosyltransferase